MLVTGQSRLTGVRLPSPIKAPLRKRNPDSVTNVRELTNIAITEIVANPVPYFGVSVLYDSKI